VRNNAQIKIRLRLLGLSKDEATIFMSLLDAPKSLLEVSRDTDIARSNIYRIVDKLMKKSIVHELTTEEGRVFACVKPEALELLVIEQEKIAENHRKNFNQILPLLQNLENRDNMFATKTYVGVAGLKQMLWNELKSETEILIYTCGPMERVLGKQWPEKYRAEIIERGIMQRSIENPGCYDPPLSLLKDYDSHYIARRISKDILPINHELTIHDDTVSIYNSWYDNVQLGTEIKNPFLANFMRQIFEHYWSLASEPSAQSL
jgi:sugar-specific transcriptional regulator TrmB